MAHPDSVQISNRFFEAIDELIRLKRLAGKKSFATRYGLNWGNFYRLRKQPQMRFELAYLAILVQDFGVSSQWLLTGEGPMFSQRPTSPLHKPESNM